MTVGIPSAEIRSLRRELFGAADEQVRRVVAMVDSLPDRGDADALIAPLRARLAQLRPARPVNFARLLFAPLDPVIVAGPAWRRETPGIPRTAVAPLAGALRQSWPELADIDRRLEGVTTHHPDRLGELGEQVWPKAATRLLRLSQPASWTEATGLGAADFAAIVLACSIVLAHGETIHAIGLDPSPDEQRHDAELATMFQAAAKLSRGQPGPIATLAAVLLARSPRADRVLAAIEISGDEAHVRGGGELGLGFVLDGMTAATLSEGSVTHAAEEARRAAAMLQDLQRFSKFRPAQRNRLEEVRRDLDQACRSRFGEALEQVLPAPGAAVNMSEAEAMARETKRLERAARQIGGSEFYDRSLKTTLQRLSQPAAGRPIDRARLVEILVGADQAEAILGAR